MVTLSVSEVLSQAWEFAKKHFLMMAVFLVVIHLISGFVTSIFGGPSMAEIENIVKSGDMDQLKEFSTHMSPSVYIGSLIASILTIGIVNTALNIAKGKKNKIDFSGFQLPATTYVKLICADIVASAIEGIGFVCCLIPGIFLTVRLSQLQTLMLDDQDLPFFDAFKKSWQMTKGSFFSIFWLGILLALINLLGFCCCFVGLFITVPLTYFAQAVIYLTLKDKMIASAAE